MGWGCDFEFGVGDVADLVVGSGRGYEQKNEKREAKGLGDHVFELYCRWINYI